MLLRICIVLTALAFVWSVAAVRNPDPASVRYLPAEAYEVVQPGMTVSEVEQIVGRPADTVNVGAVTSMMWFGRGVAFIQIRVNDDKVTHVSMDSSRSLQDVWAASE